MYCTRCGREIPAGAKYCTGCGTQVRREKRYVATGDSAFGKIRENASVLKDCSMMFVGTILGLIVCIFFLNAEMFKVTFELFSRTQTETFTMFQDKDFFKALFILAYIAAAILMLAPLLTGKEWQTWNAWPSLIIPVLAVVVLAFVAASAKGNVSDDEMVQYMMEAMDVKVKLATGGWLFIGVNVFTVVTGYMTAKAIGGAQDLQEQLREAGKQENRTVEQDTRYWCAICGEEGPFNDCCTKCGSRSKVFFKNETE